MAKIEDYIEEINQDIIFDDFSIKDTQMKLPAIKHKWVGRLITHKKIISDLRNEKQQIIDTLTNKLKETSAYKVSTPAAEKACQSHEDVVAINRKIKDNTLIVELLEKTEKVLSSMTYDIKNIVELMKLETL